MNQRHNEVVTTGFFVAVRSLPAAKKPGPHLTVVYEKPNNEGEVLVNTPMTRDHLLDLIEQATKQLRKMS